MKTNAVIRIIIWSIVILLLLGLLTTVLAFGSFSFVRSVQETSQETSALERPMDVLSNEETLTFSPDEVRELEIEWVAGSIVIQPADVTEITVSESDVSDETYAMLYKHKGNKLSIQFCETQSLTFNFGITINTDISKDLYILVPRNWECSSLEIDAASATVEVNDLTIRNVEFDGASGTCEFENCAVDTIDMDTASGDVNFFGSLNILDFDGASASIYAVLTNTPTRMDIDTMSGDLDLTLPADAGFAVSMDAMSSDFSSDFETTMKNGSHIHGDGSCRINIDAMSGDVFIRKAQQSASDVPETTNHHVHTDSCYTDNRTCPDYAHHVHDESCYSDNSTCPDYGHH